MSESEERYLANALALGARERPFPWQMNLYKRFLCEGLTEPCQSLDLPTGLGKTSVMAIWLAAWFKKESTIPLPRRLVYVVDRRAVVDQSTSVAENLRAWAKKEHQREIAISTLRGQYVDNREWMDDPAAPAIIVGTVDMIGSRLLFEGYGVSRRMRAYAAALLGTDALFVLDESHLVPSFERLLETVATKQEWRNGTHSNSPVPGFHLLSLSATGQPKASTLRLNDEDLNNPVVKKRVTAIKNLHLLELEKTKELPNDLAEKAWELAQDQGGSRVLVFCNSRKDADDVSKKLAKRCGERLALYTGARRVRERNIASETLKNLGFLAGGESEQKPSILVATSAAEVGVDLDADHMVCDLVQWERMVQRFGRVNRRGGKEANIYVLTVSEDARTKALVSPLTLLKGNASPQAVMALTANPEAQEAIQAATTQPPLYPELTDAQLQAWAMTSLREHSARPMIEPWLRGWKDEDEPQASIAWREHLPIPQENRQPNAEEVNRFFEAAPVHLSEKLETDVSGVFDWLLRRVRAFHKTLEENEQQKPLPFAYILDSAGEVKSEPALPGGLLFLEKCVSSNKKWLLPLLGSSTIVVARKFGGLNEHGLLDPKCKEFPVCADSEAWEVELDFRVESRSTEEFSDGENEKDSSKAEPPKWIEAVRFVLNTSDEVPSKQLVVSKNPRAASSEFRANSEWQSLEAHQRLAEKKARELAKTFKLSGPHTELLALSARHHDEGKAALKWQEAFSAFRAKNHQVFAKTPGPVNTQLLDGYRHELGSYLKIREKGLFKTLNERECHLALHMVCAHHGHARPLLRTRGCDERPSLLEKQAREIALRYLQLQEEWGPWGLAWWESLLRAADQQASRELKEEGGTHGSE